MQRCSYMIFIMNYSLYKNVLIRRVKFLAGMTCHKAIAIKRPGEKCINSLQTEPLSLCRINILSIVTFIVPTAPICYSNEHGWTRWSYAVNYTANLVIINCRRGGRIRAIIHSREERLKHSERHTNWLISFRSC